MIHLRKTKQIENETQNSIQKEKVKTMKSDSSMLFNVLVKQDANIYIAHCMELDIVATADDVDKVTTDILDLIKIQVSYAFSNNNLDNLYRPAPADVWEEFYACKNQIEKKIKMKAISPKTPFRFIPPWIIARTCRALAQPCHA